ncbi:hypothetical protein DSL92_07000 [Billgrantia gudaonensis]|uniref:Uncharacterized protein n=1 Tax=Billgrantia gudaonensis TaxID=376427 RepID=A0A3S0Q0Z6_9GAMM|nr:hypothetical protein DSL92_07000 [Halomonas gudaonensis]
MTGHFWPASVALVELDDSGRQLNPDRAVREATLLARGWWRNERRFILLAAAIWMVGHRIVAAGGARSSPADTAQRRAISSRPTGGRRGRKPKGRGQSDPGRMGAVSGGWRSCRKPYRPQALERETSIPGAPPRRPTPMTVNTRAALAAMAHRPPDCGDEPWCWKRYVSGDRFRQSLDINGAGGLPTNRNRRARAGRLDARGVALSFRPRCCQRRRRMTRRSSTFDADGDVTVSRRRRALQEVLAASTSTRWPIRGRWGD